MGLTGFLESAGLGLLFFAEVGALVFWLLVVLVAGGAMMDGVSLEVVAGNDWEDDKWDGEGAMVRGQW